MKICALSDLHGNLDIKIPNDTQLVLLAGDICPTFRIDLDAQLIQQGRFLFNQFYPWIAKFDHEVPWAMTPGNHDLIFQKESWMVRPEIIFNSYIDRAKHFLNPDNMDFVKVWCSPWTIPFGIGWAYNLKDQERKKRWDEIPKDVDIIVVHQPPFGLGDLTHDGMHVGCPFLRTRIEEIKPKAVICGHIHDARGSYLCDNGVTKVYNVAMCNDSYQLVNEPTILEI